MAIHYRSSESDARQLAEQIRGLGRRCLLIQADLADADQWSRIIEEAASLNDRLDALVNNASIFETMKVENFDLESWERTLRINLTAPAALCHHAAPHLRRTNGAIVNITDIAAQSPWSEHLSYCASKSGLVNLTKSLAKALAPEVRVNAVAPGIAIFPESYNAEKRERLVARVPLLKPGTPQDIAQTVRYLCCDAPYITGQIINVDGGRSIA